MFATDHANPDQVYEVFLSGVAQLGQAMSKAPHFGALPPPGQLADYGAFWAEAHV